jgi:TorA maturation chaperone TorD
MSRAEEALARASGYELLALCFNSPSAELAEAVSRAGLPLSLPFDPRTLIPEYHRLFVGPGALPAPPYESVYREGWRVFGETTLEVKRQYEEAGYALDASFTELPDHVAAELAFMALLAEEEARAWEAQDASAAFSWLDRERAFLGEHLTRWLPDFCDRLLASTEDPFYRGLAVSLQEFVTLDAERVRALTGLLEDAPA